MTLRPWIAFFVIFVAACSRIVQIGEALPPRADADMIADASFGLDEAMPDLAGADLMPLDVGPGCPDPNNGKVRYLDTDPGTCGALTFQCNPGETSFNNACGCGCIAP